MRIVQVDLDSIKSYHRERIAFTAGTNAICGPNGAGKSTLLEAVGFALFDYLPTTQAQFVREGQRVGTVTVHVVDDDERCYQVVRKCGASSQFYVYDPEIDQRLADGKTETMAWLAEYLGVGEFADLAALFRDAVGVPQGLLTAVFLEPARRRKDTFDPLLRVEEYDQAWSSLREPRRHLDGLIVEEEKCIAGLEAEVRALPGLETKAADLEMRIQADEKTLTESQRLLQEASVHKRELEKLKRTLDELTQLIARVGAQAQALKVQLVEAESAVARAEAAQATVLESESGHQAYLVAEQALRNLEEQRLERDGLERLRHSAETQMALADQQIAALKTELAAVAEARAELERLAPEVERQLELEEALAEAQRARDRLDGAEDQFVREQQRLQSLQERLAKVRDGLHRRAEIEQEIARCRGELEALAARWDELVAQIGALGAERDQVSEQTAALEDVETAVCPVCEGPLTTEHREELLSRNRDRLVALESALATAREDQRETASARDTVGTALEELDRELGLVPRPDEETSLIDQIAGQQELVERAKAVVSDLAGAPAEVERLTVALAELGDARRAAQRAGDIAERQGGIEHRLAIVREEVEGLRSRLASVTEELETFAGLDDRIDRQRAERDAQLPDHRRYLEHAREAQTLPTHRQRAVNLSSDLEAAQAVLLQRQDEREKYAAQYDATAYERVVAHCDELMVRVSTVEERLRLQRAQLDEARSEIQRLGQAMDSLRASRERHTDLGELRALLDTVRQVLREAGPQVTRTLVNIISLQAARLHADIMGDHTSKLMWTEDYGIMLNTVGREREFHQLSGGEQMVAALAVRLALLREVSSVNVAFFDEPTANLDDDRRENLAEQILRVKGFSQLFVISHDDTFERNTDNTVRIVKENGVSRVEA
ncbi:MAG: SMC family ATPase [Chloroflexi bacterium]|nr:SMC family ATPase [Chloroflexota bacterium]